MLELDYSRFSGLERLIVWWWIQLLLMLLKFEVIEILVIAQKLYWYIVLLPHHASPMAWLGGWSSGLIRGDLPDEIAWKKTCPKCTWPPK